MSLVEREKRVGLHLPVEIVHGTQDSIVPARIHAERLVTTLPDAQLTLLPGVAHMPHHTHAADVIAAIHRAAARAGIRFAARSHRSGQPDAEYRAARYSGPGGSVTQPGDGDLAQDPGRADSRVGVLGACMKRS